MNTQIFSLASVPHEPPPRADSPAEGVLELSIRQDGLAARVVQLQRHTRASIGRDSSCTVCIDDPHISRQHLLLCAGAHVLTVEDTSSNGTLAGDRLLRRESVEVPFGTPILLGSHTLLANVAPPSAGRARPEQLSTVPPAARIEPEREPASLSRLEAEARLRREIHARLVEHLDLANVDSNRLDDPSFRPRVLTALRRIVKSLEGELPAGVEPDRLVGEMADEALGLGPLERCLPTRRSAKSWSSTPTPSTSRAGQAPLTDARFTDDERVRAVIERIVTPLGRRIDESSPLVDARLPDGSRVNAVIRPLALRGSCITIRKFSRKPLTLPRLVELRRAQRGHGSLSDALRDRQEEHRHLRRHRQRQDHAAQRALSAAIPSDERIVTIEDAAELQLDQPHVVSLETRPANMEGKGEYSIRDLVQERAAHASRSHRRRRVSRRRGARHAAGHEHRSRRLAHDDSRQLAA